VFRDVRTAVRAGASLAEALQKQPQLPACFAPSVAAAEAAGTLADTFAQLAGALERTAQVRARVRSALVYPVVLGLSSVIGTLVILLIVVPRFSTLLTDTGSALPLSTRLLLSLSGALSAGGWLLLPALLVAAAWWQRAQRDPAQRAVWDARRLRWPVFGEFERQRETARYLGTLALALASGVSLLRALALARATVRNAALAAALEPAEARVRDGGALAGALRDALPPIAVRLLEAGEAGGDLASLARRAADAADDNAERQLGRVVALIEPVMILGFGGIVAFVALALLQAIYGLNAGLA
jgi:type II secretory pathway component PulF